MQQTQAQVDEVVGMMGANLEKIMQRDRNLHEMDYRAGEREFINIVFPSVVI